jgi:hypothetical protein
MWRVLMLVCGVLIPLAASGATYGVANEPSTTIGDAYTDASLDNNCSGNTYNKATRLCNGSDGRGYTTFQAGVQNLQAGETLLVRGGTYSVSSQVQVPSGTQESHRRTIKRYAQESVTLTIASLYLENYATVAGLTIQAHPTASGRMLQPYGSHSIIRNNILNAATKTGHTASPINFGCASETVLEGNDVRMPANWDLVSSGCVRSWKIRRNKFTSPAAATGDAIAINSWSGNGELAIIEENWFVNMGTGGEEYLDFKYPKTGASGGVIIRKNFFDGTGQAAEKACLRVVGHLPGQNVTLRIEDNVFFRCETSGSTRGVALASDGNAAPYWNSGTGMTVQRNLFYCNTSNSSAGSIQLELDGATFLHNTFVRCRVNLQEHSTHNPSVDGITWRSNLMHENSWAGDSMGTGNVTCTHNTWFNATSTPPWYNQCTSNSTDDPSFVDITTTGGVNLNITDVANHVAHDGGVRGALQPPTLSSCAVDAATPTTNRQSWSSAYSPITVRTLPNIVTKVGGSARTNTSSTASGLTTTTSFSGAPVSAGQAVTTQLLLGAVENAQCLGGPEYCAGGQNVATTSDKGCVNTSGSAESWVAGTTRTVPAGTNRVLVAAMCLEKEPPLASPVTMTSCTYGGQAMTKIGELSLYDAAGPGEVLAAQFLLNEAGIAAATNTTLVCTPDEAPNSARPLTLVSAAYNNVNQTTPTLNVRSASVITGTTLATTGLSPTANPGVAIQLMCTGKDGSIAPGAGWTEQIDIAEDAGPSTRTHVADRTTSGDTPAGSATFTNAQAPNERLVLLAVALNGGGASLPPNPSGIVTRTQTASRCAFHNAPGWQGEQDAPCMIVPGHHLAIVGEYTITEAPEPSAIGKQLSCCWSNCDEPDEFFPVDNAGTNGVRYAPSGLFEHGMLIDERLLTGPECTHVPGAFVTEDTMIPQALAVGQCSTMAYIVEVLATVNPATNPVLTCTMALDDNTPFAPGARTTIQVRKGNGSGQ